MPRIVLKVCGWWWMVVVGGGWWWWLRPILVFSLTLDQAEKLTFSQMVGPYQDITSALS